jgi:hypothetical protein
MAKFKNEMLLTLNAKVVKPSGKKEFKEVGKAKIPLPVLEDFGIQGKPALAETDDPKQGLVKGQPIVEDGVPVYADPVQDWLMQAIAFRVAAISRNRFKDGVLKPGASLAEDFDALTAETARTGEALALRRDARTSFEAYLQSKNKKAATVSLLSELFWNSSKVLASAGEKYVEALSTHVALWIDTLDDAKKSRFAPKIMELQESINNATEQTTVDDEDLKAA